VSAWKPVAEYRPARALAGPDYFFGHAPCYLGLNQFSGLSWDERERLLIILWDAGVVVAPAHGR
jgi:hypothetical protein